MKKMLYIFLALCLVLCLAACGGTKTSNGIKSDHIHCVCAGNAEGVGAHKTCAKNDGWQKVATAEELEAAMDAASTAKPAYVVLTEDVTIKTYLQVALGKTVNICLNGKKLNASARVIGELNITDCTGTGTVVSEKNNTVRTYAGSVVNVYAGTITTTGAKDDTQIVVLRGTEDVDLSLSEAESVFTLYGGKIEATGKTSKLGHCVYLDSFGTLKMYNGTICNGYVEATENPNRYGGNIAVYGSNSAFYLFGGEVRDGTATYSGGKNATAGLGGNIYVYRGALYAQGGTISGGHTDGYGGNIGTNNKPLIMDFRNCVIKDGVADGTNGGNIYIQGAGQLLSFENVTISGGKASAGGNIYINQATAAVIKDCTISDGKGTAGSGLTVNGKNFTVEMVGDVKFINNENSDIQMLYYSSNGEVTQSRLAITNLTATGPIVVSAKKKMEFTEDTVANHPFVAVEGMSISEVNGKLVIDKAG